MSGLQYLKSYIQLFIIIIIAAGCSSNKNYYSQVPFNRVTLIKNDTLIQFNTLPTHNKKTVNLSKEKSYSWFKADTILTTKGAYFGKLLDGDYIELYPNKALKVKGKFSKGLKDDKWQTWFINGEMESEYNWVNGNYNGEFKEFTNEGKLLKRGSYKNGKPVGEFSDSLLDGRIHKVIYNEGVIIADTIIAKNHGSTIQ